MPPIELSDVSRRHLLGAAGASLASRLAGWVGVPSAMRLCLWGGALSIGLLALLPSYPLWLLLRS